MSKSAALKSFEDIAAECSNVRFMNANHGAMETATRLEDAKLGVKIPMDDEELVPSADISQISIRANAPFTVSLSAGFLLWATSPESELLR